MCEQRGAQLASFHSDEEVQAIVQITAPAGNAALFIGLSSNGFSKYYLNGFSTANFNNLASQLCIFRM